MTEKKLHVWLHPIPLHTQILTHSQTSEINHLSFSQRTVHSTTNFLSKLTQDRSCAIFKY